MHPGMPELRGPKAVDIVSIPLAFLLGAIGTLTSKDNESKEKAAEMEVRSFTGVGVEKVVAH